MKIGAYIPEKLPYSVMAYVDNLLPELKSAGCSIAAFDNPRHLPKDFDLIWDPRAGREGPPARFLKFDKPIVATFHGAVYMSLPISECFGISPLQYARGLSQKLRTLHQWGNYHGKRLWVIGVSEYARREFVERIGIRVSGSSYAYHGVDHGVFRPADAPHDARYFLHVSSYQPVKNIKRTINAFLSFVKSHGSDMRLIVISPGFSYLTRDPRLTIISNHMPHKYLAKYYQEATAFLFPSLRETFGMPILEAMASGCPVITSNSTGCAEVAGDAALLVNPRSEASISEAMTRIASDAGYRAELSARGIERARQFTWTRSARMHLDAFEQALRIA